MSLSARPPVHERSFTRDRLELRVHLADRVTIALHILGGCGCSNCKRHRVGLLLSVVRLVQGRRLECWATSSAVKGMGKQLLPSISDAAAPWLSAIK